MKMLPLLARGRRHVLRVIGLVSLVAATATPAFSQTGETGTLSGTVRNQASGAPLQGASVSLGDMERFMTFTESDGSFRLTRVPVGVHSLVVNYTGLQTGKAEVVVSADRTAITQVELTSDIYRMEAFEVSTVREGQAAAINEQKNAANVLAVVATDAFGNVADTNVGNLLIKLSGISPERDEAETYQISVRGISPDLNSVSVDGTLLAGASSRGSSRAFEVDKVSTNSIESIEVIKAPTPEHDADSIGGKINLRTKNGFDGRGRHIRYSLGSNVFLQRYASPASGAPRHKDGLLDFARADAHPSFGFNYSDVLGREQRLAITFNASFNRTFSPRTALRLGYENNPPVNGIAIINDFQTTEDDILLDRLGIGGKIHYKLNSGTTLFLNVMYNDFNDEMSQHKLRLGNTRLVGTATETVQDINARTEYEMERRTRTVETGMVQIGGRTLWRDYDIDYDVSGSTSYGTDQRQIFSLRHSNITLRIDSSNSVHFPSIAQIAGADIADYNRGSVNYLDRQLYEAWDDVYASKLNVKRTFDTRFPLYLKTGLRYRGQEKTQDRWKPRWSYTGGGDLNRWRDDGRRVFPVEGRYQRWVWPNFLAAHREIDTNPERFNYNVSRAIDQDLKDDFEAGERIYATYLMGNVVTGRLTTLAGVRVEKTETYGTNRGQDEAYATGDPRRYANFQSIEGGYTNTFPGLHLRYAVTPKWVFRASASTAIGRPNFNRLFPGMRVRDRTEDDDEDDDDIPRIEMNNPDIKPQFSDNYDFSSEYYFGRGVGMVSVGLFRKELTDFIFTYDTRIGTGANNGFNGQYDGWVLRTRRNGGWARVDGLELNYQQQLSFLPGFLNAFGLHANMTFLRTRGTYDGEIIRDEIQGFTERSANAGISYIKHGFTIRASANYNGGRLTNYDDDPMELVYDAERTSVDFSIKYALRRLKSSVFLDVNNLTNSKRTKYQAYENRQLDTQIYGMRITAGISGEF